MYRVICIHVFEAFFLYFLKITSCTTYHMFKIKATARHPRAPDPL